MNAPALNAPVEQRGVFIDTQTGRLWYGTVEHLIGCGIEGGDPLDVDYGRVFVDTKYAEAKRPTSTYSGLRYRDGDGETHPIYMAPDTWKERADSEPNWVDQLNYAWFTPMGSNHHH